VWRRTWGWGAEERSDATGAAGLMPQPSGHCENAAKFAPFLAGALWADPASAISSQIMARPRYVLHYGSDQSRSGAAIDPDHRGYLLCA
jgi:hypothetical protein